MDKLILGIAGEKESGKDEAFSAIDREFPGLVKRMAFADDLKLEVFGAIWKMCVFGDGGKLDKLDITFGQLLIQLGVTIDQEAFIAEFKANSLDVTAEQAIDYINRHKTELRKLLQYWGTEYRRALFDEQYWINKIDIKIEHSGIEESIIVFTDARFPNEHDYIHDNGGSTLKVIRPREESGTDTHSSETLLGAIPCDWEILNDGTIEQLHEKACDVFTDFLGLETGDAVEELVLVVPASKLPSVGDGLYLCDLDLAEEILDEHGQYRRRSKMEVAPVFRQAIPYVLVAGSSRAEGGFRYLAFQRTKVSGEARLAGKKSIGFGGHVNIGDDHYLEGMLREIDEELILPKGSWLDTTPIGLLMCSKTAVDKVHVGLVHVASLRGGFLEDIKSNDPAVELISLVNPYKSPGDMGEFESWSQICLSQIADLEKKVAAQEDKGCRNGGNCGKKVCCSGKEHAAQPTIEERRE